MKNKIKLLLIPCIVICINSQAQNPSGIFINYIPMYCYSRFLPSGNVPAAFNLKRFNGSESLGIGYNKCINSHLSASLSIYFDVNNYRYQLFRDYNPLEKKYVQRNSSTTITSAQPLLMFTWSGFRSHILDKCYISTGISYNINNSVYDTWSISFSQNNADTFYWSRQVNSRKATNFGWHIEIGKTYRFSKRIDLQVGLRIKLGQGSKITTHQIYITNRNYKFETMSSPSYVGVSGRLIFHRIIK